ncbi:hypothetical protein GW17_00052242 [Ensete ventricosum]|nr:hypothetical protein GW17_00052242 [Ensete ventricosum]
MGSQMSMVSRKNVTIINFVQSLVSFCFSCTISEFQNIGYFQRTSSWEVVRAQFRKKMRQPLTLCKVARKVKFR